MSGVAAGLRRPRCRLLVSGSVVDGCHAVEISTSNMGQAGVFFVQIANRTGQPSQASSWYDADTLDVSIELGFLPPGMAEGALSWQEMMSGRVDRIRLNPITGTMTLEGRDYAARLLDLTVTEGFLNCTSSEIAEQLAARCGLTAVVDQTSVMIGQYYQIEHARSALTRFSRFSTGWDLLSGLAQLEQFNLWVQGSSLFFQSSSNGGTVRPVVFNAPDQNQASPSLNLSGLLLERSLALAGGLPVAVSSWNSRQRERVTAQSGSASSNATAVINVIRPNLSTDTAQMLANGIYNQTSGHERTVTGTMPGDLVLSPRDTLRLTGVGGGWDGDYRVDSIDREITLTGGFVQGFTARTLTS